MTKINDVKKLTEMIDIIKVKPMNENTLFLTFSNGKQGTFDASRYLEIGKVFEPLRNPSIFKSVRVHHGTIEWPGEIDLCPDCVYAETKFI